MPRRRKEPSVAPHAYSGLDRVLHEKARLGIAVALLQRPDGVLFQELKDLCELTDGNLARHLAVLAEAGVVQQFKSSAGPRPKTLVQITERGRELFFAYLDELERVVLDARASALTKQRRQDLGPQWSPA